MNPEGTRAWSEIAKENVGKSIAIVLDGQVISATTIREPIPNNIPILNG